MKFTKFTGDELNEINRRTSQRLRGQDTAPAGHGDATTSETASKFPRLGYARGDANADDIRQAINKAFVENPAVLNLTRNDIRTGLISASKKINEKS